MSASVARSQRRALPLGAARMAARRVGRARAAADRRATGAGARSAPASRRRRREAVRLAGPVLPGLVDAHSHAFQRAFAGLAERREAGRRDDDFWSWRERMYAVAQRVTPELLRAIAAHLFVELLRGGYTQVCEFHYLQHRADGTPTPTIRSRSPGRSPMRRSAGIGLTLLPVLYERAGFDAPALRPEQRRFVLDADATWTACGASPRPAAPTSTPASRSIRCAPRRRLDRARCATSPRASTDRSTSTSPSRRARSRTASRDRPAPGRWLAAQPGLLDSRWQLVHATHVTPAEIDAVAASGAGIVVCPTHGGQSRRRRHRSGALARPRRGAALDRLRQQRHARVARGAALARVRPAPCARRAATWPPGGHRDRARPTGLRRAAAPLATRARRRRAAAFGAQAACGIAVGARADLLVVDPPSQPDRPAGEPSLDALVFSSPGRPGAT